MAMTMALEVLRASQQLSSSPPSLLAIPTSSKIASGPPHLVPLAPPSASPTRDFYPQTRALAIRPPAPLFRPAAHAASRTKPSCASRGHGALTGSRRTIPWGSWPLERARDVGGNSECAKSENGAGNQWERNLRMLDGFSSSSCDGRAEACRARVEAKAVRDTGCGVCDTCDRSKEQENYNIGFSSSQTRGNGNRNVLRFVGSVLLMLGAGLALSRPAFAKPLASEATVTAVENSETTSVQEEKEAAGKGDGDASSQVSDESHSSSSETANKVEGLGREFWEGFETSDESPELILRMYTERYPENTQALEALLHLVLEKQDFPRALKILELLIKLEPDELEWKFMKAQSHECEGELEVAREGFEELLRLRPLSARALQGMIMVLDQIGEEDAAFLMVEKALARAIQENKPVEARNLRMLSGQYHTLKGDLGEALKQYKYMIDEDPKDFRPYLCQGIVYSVLGEKDEAEKQFKRFQQLCPKDFPNRSHLDELMKKATHEGRKMYELKQKAFEKGTEGKREAKPV